MKHHYSNTNNNISYKQEESIMNIDTYSVPRSVSNDDDYEEDDNKENNHHHHHKTIMSTNGRNGISIKSNNTKVDLSSTKITSSMNDDNNINNNDVENYLKAYETMIQQQEHVEQTVLTHLIPCIQRLIQLMKTDPTTTDSNNEPQQGINQETYYKSIQLHDEISYKQLYKVYQQLQQIKLPVNDKNNNDKNDTNTTTITTPMTISYLECMMTDKQLMMVLRILTEQMNHENITTSESTNTKTASTTITWAEFILCYQICIISMMTIQYIPKKTYARIRTRERSISILHLFQNHYMNSSISSTTTNFGTGINDSIYPIQQPSKQNLIHEYRNLIQNSYSGNNNNNMTNSNHSIGHVQKVDIPRQQQQRRPWLKKRTKRLISKFLLLIFTMIMLYVLYYTFIVQMVDTNRLSSSILVSFLSLPMYHTRQKNNINHSNQQQHTIPNHISNEYNHSSNTMKVDSTNNNNNNKIYMNNNADIDNSMDYHIVSKNRNGNNAESIPYNNKKDHLNVLKVQPTTYHPLLGIWSNF